MSAIQDGPKSSLFRSLPLKGNVPLIKLANIGVTDEVLAALEHAPSGDCTAWGIPFEIEDVVVLTDRVFSIELTPTVSQWLVFMHTSDLRPLEPNPSGFISPMRGEGQLGEHAADYVILYADGTEQRVSIRRRLHNRMHALGYYHHHTPVHDHQETN